MSAPNITVKFLEPEELNDYLRKSDIKAKTSESTGVARSNAAEEEVPEIVQESVKAEGPPKDNIAREDNTPPRSTSAEATPALPAVAPALPAPAPAEPQQPRPQDQSADKAPAAKVARKKLLGSAIDHSRYAAANGGRTADPGAPASWHSNKVGIGLLAAGIVGLLLTGRS